MLTKELLICEFDTLLEIFNERVKRGEYEKFEYYLWKQMKHFIDNVKIDFHSNGEITIFSNNERIFLTCDNSFAHFLFDYYLPETKIKKEEKNMAVDAATIDIGYSNSTADNDYLNNIYYSTTSDYYTTSGTTDSSKIYQTIENSIKTFNLEDYTITNRKEEKKMNSNITFDFGPVNSNVKMSMYGMAIKNKAGNYVSYDATTDSIIDVDVFQFDGSKFMYKIPAAVNSIKAGDVVVHQGAPCFVKGLPDSMMNTLNVVDVYASEQKEIMLPKSIYGFHYCTKVINLMDGVFSPMVADESNPFGNMLPLMLMNGNGGKMDDMLPLMLMMNQNGSGNTNMFANPMMMYFMMKGDKNIDPMMLMLMMNQQVPAHDCKCKRSDK